VNQLEARASATARTLAARRRQLEDQRERAGQRLADAEQRLDRLGWRGRGRRGDELRSEVALQRTAIRMADEKLKAPIPRPPEQRSRRDPDWNELARSLERLRRDALQRERGLERDRGFGLEL
jgi:hypothetical protein